MPQPQKPPSGRSRAGPLQVGKAVFWSFFGVRRGEDRDHDAANITPLQAIVAGIIGASVFVIGLLLIVRWVTG